VSARAPGGDGVPRLDHVSVTCADLERSVAFYRDALGLPLLGSGESGQPELSEVSGYPDTRIRWAELDLGGGQLLELIEYLEPRGEPLAQRVMDPGSGHIGLTVHDADAMHARLVAAGVHVRSEPVTLTEEGDWNGVRTLYISDPDGATIELVERAHPRVVVIPEAEAEASPAQVRERP
jgi:catechol 2,3-dioxygenase-like lactoylglutathione lyase family enzyme